MSLKELKRTIGIKINKSHLRPIFEMINLLFYHWDDRMHWMKRESNEFKERTCLIIRPETSTQGLLSSYLYVLKYIRFADKHGYVAYVDFQSDNCQYYSGRLIDNTLNAWEYYFEQPYGIDRETAYSYPNILLSGWAINDKKKVVPIPKTPRVIRSKEIRELARNFGRIKKYVNDMVEEKYKELFSGKVLGVFIRGTDYVKLQPKGHAIQPQIEDVINKIREFLTNYNINKVFVVTEDAAYYQRIVDTFGDVVFTSDNDFVHGYDKQGYVSAAFKNDPYERGLNYLVRVLLIGKCEFLISGVTNGSLVARCMKEGDYEDEYWFELGVY